MSRFNILLSIFITLLFIAKIAAQPTACDVDKKQLEATIVNIDLTELGTETVKAVDCSTLEHEAGRLTASTTSIDAGDSQAVAEQLNQPYAVNFFTFQKEKIIEKVYPVNSNSQLSIDNRYGNIRIHNWIRNEVKVTVRIRTAENSERRAQEALDRVHIDAAKSGNSISFKTAISSGDANWWSQLTSGVTDRALRVDYEVYLPKGNELVLVNRYGGIELDDRDGKVAISVSYGSLLAGRLNGYDNALAVAYSKAQVEYLNEGDVSVRYGGFTLAESEKLRLAMSSSGGEIGKVNREADISLKYSGGFEVGLGPAIQKATIAASYSNINIRPSADAAFHFDVAVSHGGFDYDRNRISIGSKAENHSSKSYTGYWNRAVNNTVSVSSRYGAVTLR